MEAKVCGGSSIFSGTVPMGTPVRLPRKWVKHLAEAGFSWGCCLAFRGVSRSASKSCLPSTRRGDVPSAHLGERHPAVPSVSPGCVAACVEQATEQTHVPGRRQGLPAPRSLLVRPPVLACLLPGLSLLAPALASRLQRNNLQTGLPC